MRLVHDADNLIELEVHNPHLIPSIARTFADKCEQGEFGMVSRAVLVLETDTGPLRFFWGETFTHEEAVGTLHLAAYAATIDAIDSFDD